ncbi:MAG TPA: hypothetical protein VHT04_15765, partial [Stellaceae bacterium]|nr:hypothetical protein [Stellaceae bacterium]
KPTPARLCISLNDDGFRPKVAYGVRREKAALFKPHSHDAAHFRARSTSHTVAAHSGCTNIPLAAGRAQEDENHSRKRRFRPWLASVRPPGSARTDQILEDDGIRLVCVLSGFHHGAFDDHTGGRIFPKRDQ